MRKLQNNFALIDSQNLNLGIKKLGWKLDYRRFRVYLEEKYSVKKAYIFIGYIASNQKLYDSLTQSGYTIIFEPTIIDRQGKIKGNVDADLVLQVMIDWSEFENAVIITSDGDFYSLVKHLYKMNKLEAVLSPNINECSKLLVNASKEKIDFLNNLEAKLKLQ